MRKRTQWMHPSTVGHHQCKDFNPSYTISTAQILIHQLPVLAAMVDAISVYHGTPFQQHLLQTLRYRYFHC